MGFSAVHAFSSKLTFDIAQLFQAVPQPKANKLEVVKTSTSNSGYPEAIVTRKFIAFKQGFDYTDLPFHSLLGRFGDLIPEAKYQQIPDHTYGPCGPYGSAEPILVRLVCFSILQSLAGWRIEWVTSLSLHLELDSGRKTLKVFQFPSYCRMMAVDKESHILSRLDFYVKQSEQQC